MHDCITIDYLIRKKYDSIFFFPKHIFYFRVRVSIAYLLNPSIHLYSVEFPVVCFYRKKMFLSPNPIGPA